MQREVGKARTPKAGVVVRVQWSAGAASSAHVPREIHANGVFLASKVVPQLGREVQLEIAPDAKAPREACSVVAARVVWVAAGEGVVLELFERSLSDAELATFTQAATAQRTPRAAAQSRRLERHEGTIAIDFGSSHVR